MLDGMYGQPLKLYAMPAHVVPDAHRVRKEDPSVGEKDQSAQSVQYLQIRVRCPREFIYL